MNGAINFTADRPPQTFIFCGICDSHFMMCTCTGLGYGNDYILKGLPPPSPNLNRVGLLRRFASIASALPSMRAFDAVAWHANEAEGLSAAIESRRAQLRQMIEDYIATLPTSEMLGALALAVGGQPLQDRPASIQSSVIANECRASLSSFISGDWATVTRVGTVLIQNAFQVSDPNRYRLDDTDLQTIFQSGIGVLHCVQEMGYSDRGGRLAMECDRPPQGTDEPIESATDRDYFINNVNPQAN